MKKFVAFHVAFTAVAVALHHLTTKLADSLERPEAYLLVSACGSFLVAAHRLGFDLLGLAKVLQVLFRRSSAASEPTSAETGCSTYRTQIAVGNNNIQCDGDLVTEVDIERDVITVRRFPDLKPTRG
jgi:hypothetical protein